MAEGAAAVVAVEVPVGVRVEARAKAQAKAQAKAKAARKLLKRLERPIKQRVAGATTWLAESTTTRMGSGAIPDALESQAAAAAAVQ